MCKRIAYLAKGGDKDNRESRKVSRGGSEEKGGCRLVLTAKKGKLDVYEQPAPGTASAVTCSLAAG